MDGELREKVIKGMEYCIDYVQRVKDIITDVPCVGCPYVSLKGRNVGAGDCVETMFYDALALLKAQEPQMVEERADTDTINCPKCGQQFARVGQDKSVYLDLDEEPDYCWKCGQAVKWE